MEDIICRCESQNKDNHSNPNIGGAAACKFEWASQVADQYGTFCILCWGWMYDKETVRKRGRNRQNRPYKPNPNMAFVKT